ncbi:MAG TPA: hypothetical protein VNS09_08360 [Solirubrobacter sp.]|nr:hypothetical protein [Solirubrobacter sp.]
MSSAALADLTSPKPGRRARAAKTVEAALRGGVLAGAVAALAWLLAVVMSGAVFFLLVVATVLALVYTVVRGDKARMGVWGLIAIAWALVLAERWVVNANGGIIVAGAAYVGVVLGARRAGIAKKSLVLLLYPLISLAIVLAADQSVLRPWGASWLWVLAVLGPVLGARTLVNPSPRDHQKR